MEQLSRRSAVSADDFFRCAASGKPRYAKVRGETRAAITAGTRAATHTHLEMAKRAARPGPGPVKPGRKPGRAC